ncbi:MAG: hypothetical protein FWF29_02025 [Treponema sp.]|nr:hypothetical protein [Treponema sp.]
MKNSRESLGIICLAALIVVSVAACGGIGAASDSSKKKDPVVSWPVGLQVEINKTLDDLLIPAYNSGTEGGFTWKAPDTPVGARGMHTFPMIFTPTDTTAYKIVSRGVQVNVIDPDKNPVVNWPSGYFVVYGKTLGDITLPADNGTGTAGTFSWTAGASASPGAIGTRVQKVTFTPADTVAYNILIGDVNVTVTDGTTAGVQDDGSLIVYNGGWYSALGNVDEIFDVSDWLFEFENPVVVGGYDTAVIGFVPGVDIARSMGQIVVQNPENISYGYWDQANKEYVDNDKRMAILNIGGTAGIPATATLYRFMWKSYDSWLINLDVFQSLKFSKRLTPTVNWPSGLSAIVGQTLGSVTLPGNGTGTPGTFSWTQDTSTVFIGPAGSQMFNITFTPTDRYKYNLANKDVAVTVANDGTKEDPIVNWPAGLSAVIGQTLADIPLPGNDSGTAGTFSWTEDISTSVGTVGAQAHNVTFTPANTQAYYNLAKNITVTVTDGSTTGVQEDGSFILYNGAWFCGDVTHSNPPGDIVITFSTPVDVGGYKHAILQYFDIYWYGYNAGQFIKDGGGAYTYWDGETKAEFDVPVVDNVTPVVLTLDFSRSNDGTGLVDASGAIPEGTKFSAISWKRNADYNESILSKITLTK